MDSNTEINKNPLIAVVCPVFCKPATNGFDFLQQAVASFISQTYPNKILVLVDDKSIDLRVSDFYNQLQNIHKNIVILKNEENMEQARTMNKGVTYALDNLNPKYITLLYADDILPKGSLEMRVRHAESHNAVAVFSDFLFFYPTRNARPEIMKSVQFESPKALYWHLLQHKPFPALSWIWEATFFKNHINKFDESLIASEDWDFSITTAQKAMQYGGKIAYAPGITYLFNRNNIGKSIRNLHYNVKLKAYHDVLKKHLKQPKLFIYDFINFIRLTRIIIARRYNLPESISTFILPKASIPVDIRALPKEIQTLISHRK